MKKVFALLTVLALCLTACVAFALQTADVVGRWTSVTVTENENTSAAEGDLRIELREDGTMLFPDVDDTVYTWKIDDDVIELYNPDGSLSEVTIIMENNRLLLDDGMYCFTMKRENQ